MAKSYKQNILHKLRVPSIPNTIYKQASVFLLLSVIFFSSDNKVYACDTNVQCCRMGQAYLPGTCYIERCDLVGRTYVSRVNGSEQQCMLHVGQPDCCLYEDYSFLCGGCYGADFPVMNSACVSIDINGQSSNVDLVSGQTYTAHVTMRNVGSRVRDSWTINNIPYEWPSQCDGREGNGEADVITSNECPAVLVDVDSIGNKNTTNIWGLDGGSWFGQPNFYRWGITSSNPAPNTSLRPTQTITYTFNFVAPSVGTYDFRYRMLKHIHPDDGAEWAPFGQVCSIDSVHVNPNVHSISGRLWITQNNCSESHNTAGPILKTPNNGVVDVNNEHVFTGAIDSNKNYVIQNVTHGKSITSLFVNNNPLNPPVDYNYVPTCFMTDQRANSGNGITFPAQTLNTNVTGWDIGYKQVSNLEGWFTVQDGDVFANNLINLTMPTNPPAINLFAGYLIEKSNTGQGGYAFSNDNITVATQSNTPRVYQANGGGFVKYLVGDMATALSFWPSKYSTFRAPDNTVPFTATTLNSTLTQNTVYLVDSAAALGALNNITAATYSVASNGTAIVMVTQPGTVTFKHNLRVAAGNTGRLVFVLGKGVNATIDRNIGYSVALDGEPTMNSRPNMEAAIIAVDENSNITFSGTPNKTTSPDTTVIMEGPVVAATTSLKRNKGDNNSTPAEVIKYRSKYFYDLTSWERSSSSNKTGLFVTDIVYQYGN